MADPVRNTTLRSPVRVLVCAAIIALSIGSFIHQGFLIADGASLWRLTIMWANVSVAEALIRRLMKAGAPLDWWFVFTGSDGRYVGGK